MLCHITLRSPQRCVIELHKKRVCCTSTHLVWKRSDTFLFNVCFRWLNKMQGFCFCQLSEHNAANHHQTNHEGIDVGHRNTIIWFIVIKMHLPQYHFFAVEKFPPKSQIAE